MNIFIIFAQNVSFMGETYSEGKPIFSNQIEKFCNALRKCREFVGLSVYDMEKAGMNHVIVNSLEKGEKFSMKSVYKYLAALQHSGAFFIYVYDEEIQWGMDASTPEAFGKALKEYRTMKKVTLSQMLVRTGLGNGQVLNIEKGKSCTGSTLIKYFSIFPNLNIDVAIR